MDLKKQLKTEWKDEPSNMIVSVTIGELRNLTKHNNDFKKVCSKCGVELSKYSVLEDGVCNQCSVGMKRKPIQKS